MVVHGGVADKPEGPPGARNTGRGADDLARRGAADRAVVGASQREDPGGRRHEAALDGRDGEAGRARAQEAAAGVGREHDPCGREAEAGRYRGVVGRKRSARGVTGDHEPPPVGRDAGQRDPDPRQRVGQEAAGRGEGALVARVDDDVALADKMVEPRAVDPRVSGKDAMDEDDDRTPGARAGRLEDDRARLAGSAVSSPPQPNARRSEVATATRGRPQKATFAMVSPIHVHP